MAVASIPNRPAGTPGPRSIASLLADFDAITTFLNGGNMDPDNLSDSLVNAKLGLTKPTGPITRRGFAQVATSEATTSTVIADLATNGPAITVRCVTNGLLLVFAQADISQTGGATGIVSLDEATGTNKGDILSSTAAGPVTLFTGSTGGSVGTSTSTAAYRLMVVPAGTGDRIFKLRYRRTAGTNATFANRKLWVISIDPS